MWLIKQMRKFVTQIASLSKSSHCFRVISTVILTRIILTKLYRTYYKLPNGPLTIKFGFLLPDWFESIASNYGNAVSITFGPKSLIVFNNPYLCKKVYSDSRTLDVPNILSSPYMFVATNGSEWKKRRKIIFTNLMSTMRASYVENKTKQFVETKVFPVFDEMIKNDKIVETKKLFRPIGFNIVLQAMFGKQLKSLNDPLWIKWFNSVEKVEKSVFLKFGILILFGGTNKVSNYIQSVLCDGALMEQFIDLIPQINEISLNEKPNLNKNKNKNIKLFDEYVDEYRNKWTRKQLLGDLTIMFLGATDTTSSALSFALLLAAKYPSVQQEIYEEVISAFGDTQHVELKNNGINKIPKLRAFIHETLRIYPIAPAAGFRDMTYDGFTFSDDGKQYNIPKGTNYIFNIFAIHKNPKFWKPTHKNINMNKVHFDFWLNDDGLFDKKKNHQSFLPFGLGKRSCIGQPLAMKELMIVLAMIFIKYKIYGPNGNETFEIKSILGAAVYRPIIKGIRLKKRQ